MSKTTLLGTTLAVALAVVPGLASAAQTSNANAANATIPSNHTAANTQLYGSVGNGSYTGDQMPIKGNGNNNAQNPANANNMRPSKLNSDLADNGDARASKVIGTTVYNDKDQKLGSVNDILIGSNGVFAVISTNKQKVAVPFKDLVFGNSRAKGDDKLVLPNTTQAQLNTDPVIHYNETNYASNGNGNNSGRRFVGPGTDTNPGTSNGRMTNTVTPANGGNRG